MWFTFPLQLKVPENLVRSSQADQTYLQPHTGLKIAGEWKYKLAFSIKWPLLSGITRNVKSPGFLPGTFFKGKFWVEGKFFLGEEMHQGFSKMIKDPMVEKEPEITVTGGAVSHISAGSKQRGGAKTYQDNLTVSKQTGNTYTYFAKLLIKIPCKFK